MDILNNILLIDFTKILIFVAIYLVVLWLLICLWVYQDAKKRYKTMQLAIIFFMMVLILNFPALIFYLIVRPEMEDEHVFFMHSDTDSAPSDLGGVNVPIVNFIGEDGFKISLQLKVANPKAEKDSNLDINLDWKSNDDNMKVLPKPEPKKEEAKVIEETVVVKETKNNPGFGAKIKSVQTSAKNKFNGAKTKVTLSMKKFGKKNAVQAKPEVKTETKPEEKKEQSKIVEGSK